MDRIVGTSSKRCR